MRCKDVWLGWHTRKADIRKLNSLHYRLLRTVECDWRCRISKNKLDELGRVRPSIWAKYATASLVIKILRDKRPGRLYCHLLDTCYKEERSGRLKFFDSSQYKPGRQALGNRLADLFSEITTQLTLLESDCTIRTTLKKSFGFNVTNEQHIPGQAIGSSKRRKRIPPLLPIQIRSQSKCNRFDVLGSGDVHLLLK